MKAVLVIGIVLGILFFAAYISAPDANMQSKWSEYLPQPVYFKLPIGHGQEIFIPAYDPLLSEQLSIKLIGTSDPYNFVRFTPGSHFNCSDPTTYLLEGPHDVERDVGEQAMIEVFFIQEKVEKKARFVLETHNRFTSCLLMSYQDGVQMIYNEKAVKPSELELLPSKI